MNLLSLPPEVLQAILTRTAPRDVARFCCSGRAAHTLIQVTLKADFWRELFLASFDDPRLNPAFCSKSTDGGVTWECRVKDRTRAERDPVNYLHELARVMDEIAPWDEDRPVSANVAWIRAALGKSGGKLRPGITSYSDLDARSSSISRLLSAPGALSRHDLISSNTLSQGLRAYAYDPYRVSPRTMFGPFQTPRSHDVGYHDDDDQAVISELPVISWTHLEAVTFTIRRALICGECDPEMEGRVWAEAIRRPYNLESLRPRSAPDLRPFGDDSPDWAGVEGYWVRVTSMLDLSDQQVLWDEYLADFHSPGDMDDERGPEPTTFFSQHRDPPEDLAYAESHLWLCGEQDILSLSGEALGDVHSRLEYGAAGSIPSHERYDAKHPPLFFMGTSRWEHARDSVGGVSDAIGQPYRVQGRVVMYANGTVRWSMDLFLEDEVEWVFEGTPIGGLGSAAGIAGSWHNVGHEAEDGEPVGPFWMWKTRDDATKVWRAA